MPSSNNNGVSPFPMSACPLPVFILHDNCFSVSNAAGHHPSMSFQAFFLLSFFALNIPSPHNMASVRQFLPHNVVCAIRWQL